MKNGPSLSVKKVPGPSTKKLGPSPTPVPTVLRTFSTVSESLDWSNILTERTQSILKR